MDIESVKELMALAKKARCHTIKMIGGIGVGHVGGSMSIIDVLTYLYYREMRIRPEDPKWSERDRLVLSKGHAGPALYTMLAMKGYFNLDLLDSLNQPGTNLPSHCDMKKTIGVDMTAGSLGQGLSAAVGMALAGKTDNKAYRVFCILGDGELQEGQVWEAAMYAGNKGLDNLIAIIDDNGMQLDDYTDRLNPLHPLDKRWAAFGWATICANGHNFNELESAFLRARNIKNRPVAIILSTIKGKGISFAEAKLSSHNMPVSPTDVAHALSELQ